jgi:hypothetical protein
LFTDIRGSNLAGERIWEIHYSPGTGCTPMNFSWDPAQLPVDGYFHLVDPIFGNLVNVNMRTTNQFTDQLGLGILQIKYNYQICSNYNLLNGWNMISLPTDVTNNNYLALFPTAVTGTLYGYSSGYYSTESILNGTGYWLKFSSSQLAQVCGLDRIESDVNLTAGWNMIGGPNCNVPLSEVSDPGGIIIPGTLYGYSGSYTNSNSIDGTKAYWIKTNNSGTITISCVNTSSNKSKEQNVLAETFDEFSRIELIDKQGNSQNLYFNGKLSDDINLESFSLPPLPPPGGFDARLSGDFRLTESDEAVVLIQASDFPVVVSFSNINFEERYVLQQFVNGVELSSQVIQDGVKVEIINEQVTMLKISKQQNAPVSFSLDQNYPNPFNPSTTIKFSLPEASTVTVTIYNTLGQKVTELVNTNLQPGWYSYQWNAENSASGMYIYELRTDKFNSIKKMILMK